MVTSSGWTPECGLAHCSPTCYLDGGVVWCTVSQLITSLKLDDSVVLRTVPQLVTSSKFGHGVPLTLFPSLSRLCCWRVVLCVLSPSWSCLDKYSLTHWNAVIPGAHSFVDFRNTGVDVWQQRVLYIVCESYQKSWTGDVSIRRMKGSVKGSIMPDPRPGGPLAMVDYQRDLRPCYVQNGSFLHRESKNTRHQTLGHNFTKYYPIFKIFFTSRLGSKFATNSRLNIPRCFKHFATLPCEIRMQKNGIILKYELPLMMNHRVV